VKAGDECPSRTLTTFNGTPAFSSVRMAQVVKPDPGQACALADSLEGLGQQVRMHHRPPEM
jgi:hypothetical protein